MCESVVRGTLVFILISEALIETKNPCLIVFAFKVERS